MKIANLENIELELINTNSTKINFPDVETLRCAKVKNIDVPSVTEVTVTPLGKAVVNNTVYNKSFLVLNIDGKEQVNRIPLKSLNPYANYGTRIDFSDMKINWPKSYIEIGNSTGIVANEAFFLNIFF